MKRVPDTLGLLQDHADDENPASHADLVDCPAVAALTALMADGYPQTSVVWCDFDGDGVRFSVDPLGPLRYLEGHPAVAGRRPRVHVARCSLGSA